MYYGRAAMITTFLRSASSELVLLGLLVCLSATIALSQMAPPGGGGAISRATPLPMSGRTNQAGSASSQQTSNSVSGVGTINSSVQVSGDFSGSVPSAKPSA